MDVVNGSNKSISYIEENGITVVITAFNRREFINQAVDSVLKQRCHPEKFEIIIITNFDLTLPKTEVQIRTLNIQGTIGEYLAKGLILSKYDIVAFLDDDDVWTENKILRLARVFSDLSIVFYHNAHSYIDSQGNPLKYVRNVEKTNLDSFKSPLVFSPSSDPKRLREAIGRSADFNLSCMAVRKAVMLPFIDVLKLITSGPDAFFFWVSVISGGSIYIDNLKLTKYRVHGLNVSGAGSYEKKEKELQREIRTFSLLESLVESTHQKGIENMIVRRWLHLYISEYELISLVFGKGRRLSLVKKIISLMNSGFGCRNTLKYRALAFGLLGILSRKIALSIYSRTRS
ncbi:MAG: glycosyltransferase [Candidatus Parvarchaeota archaeon]